MLDNWKRHDECSPWLEEGYYYIVVESDHQSPGSDDDRGYRLLDAKLKGVSKLLQFYGKKTGTAPVNVVRYAAQVADYFVSYKPCVRMKVLVKVPQADFDAISDDLTACDINKPEEGYLEATLPIYTYKEQLQFVVYTLESTVLPILARSSKFITNVNILAEIKRLKQSINIIDRYLLRNKIIQDTSGYVSCPPEMEKILTIGYTYDYEAIFAIIDNEQHTIGYDCFLNNDIINHLTTANYLMQTSNMYEFLTQKNDTTFDVFEFLTRFTLPTPIIQEKENPTDGLSLYADNGVSFGWADLAKLISLDLDINLCKSDEDKAKEDDRLLDPETQRRLQDSANQITKWAGDMKLSSEGVQSLKNKLQDAQGADGLAIIYNDVLAKVNIACVLNEALQCYVDRTIQLVGEQIIEDDQDLGQVINTSISLGNMVGAQCNFQRCDGSPDIDLSIGFPVFQGIAIPANFPTLDYLATVIEEALDKLYAALINTLSSAILGILQNSCEILFDDVLGEGDASATIKDGFQNWLGDSIGVNYEDLNDPQAWGDALTSTGGTGFIGAIGNMVSRGVASGYAAYEDTGIALNLPNPQKGWEVEGVFLSAESMNTFFTDLNSATADINTVTTPSEQISLYKGSASDETQTLAFECLKLRNPAFGSLFKDKYEFADMFSAMGRLVKPEFLQNAPDPAKSPAPDFCHLGDGSDAWILRETILAEKDPDLSQTEIDAIINKEIERNTEKLRSLSSLLNKVVNGSMAPSFPSLFGAEDSLVPETPQAVKDLASFAASGIFGASMNHFSLATTQWAELWDQMLVRDESMEEGTDDDGDPIIVRLPHPRNIFAQRVHDYVVDNKHATYKFGYSAFDEEATGYTELGYSGGIESVIVRDFGGNFKGDEKDQLILDMEEQFNTSDYTISEEVLDRIIDHIEDYDGPENGTFPMVIYEPVNTLISYGIVVYHEGGWWGDNTQAMIVKVEYDDNDQPEEEGSVYLEFGRTWGNTDEANFDTLLMNTWESPPSENMREILKAYASGDYDRLSAALAIGAVSAYSGMIGTLYAIALAWGYTGATLMAAITSAIGIAGALVMSGLILVAVLLKLFAFKDDIKAQRFVYGPNTVTTGIPGSITYDITVDEKGGWLKVIKRNINPDVILSNSRPSDWPTNLVSITQNVSPAVEAGMAGTTNLLSFTPATKITQWIQDYEIGNSMDRLGKKIDTPGITDIAYRYTPTSPIGAIQSGLIGDALEASQEGLEEMLAFMETFQVVTGLSDALDDIISEAYEELPTGVSLQSMALSNIIGSTLKQFFPNDGSKIDTIMRSIQWIDHKRLCDAVVRQMNLHIYSGGPDLWDAPTYSNRYWTSAQYGDGDGFGEVNLAYPVSDILQYTQLLSDIQEFVPKLMKLKLDNTYCDNLSATRRAGVSYGIILLIRMYLVEQALITPQVFDAFSPSFMESKMFATHILNTLKEEMGKYQTSFPTLGEHNLYNDLESGARTYFEIKAVLGDESPTFDYGEDALRYLVEQETINLRSSIASALKLKYSSSSNWDDFIMKELFPLWDAATEAYASWDATPAPPIASYGADAVYQLHIKQPTNYGDPFEFPSKYWIGNSVYADIDGDPFETDAPTGMDAYEITKNSSDDSHSGASRQYKEAVPESVLREIGAIYDYFVARNTPGSFDTRASSNFGPGGYVPLAHDAEKSGTAVIGSGDVSYTIEYEFKIKGRNIIECDPDDEDCPDVLTWTDENGEEQAYYDNDHQTLYKIKVDVSGDFSSDYLERYSATSITNPFYYDQIGLSFERYVVYKTKDATRESIDGLSNFLSLLERDISSGIVDQDTKWSDHYKYLRFGLRMVYMDSTAERDLLAEGRLQGSGGASPELEKTEPKYDYEDTTVGTLVKALEDVTSQSKKNKCFVLEGQPKIINGDETIVRYISIPLASAECGYNPHGQYLADIDQQNPTIAEFIETIAEQYDTNIFSNLTEILWDSAEYRAVVDQILPLKDIAAAFSLYEYAALSDETVFITGTDQMNLYQMMATPKLAVLQILQSSIYGTGDLRFQDPFIQQANTDLIIG